MEAEDELIQEIYSKGDEESSRNRPIISGEQLDIEAYASLYQGRTKITRLMFIAEHCCDDASMQLEALRMAYHEIKKGEDTQLFREVLQKIDGRLGPNYTMDVAWCDSVDHRAEKRKKKIETELNAYKTNFIKESIRMGYNDFGDFYYAHGALGDAFKSYFRARDYCTTSKHIIHMHMRAILVSIEMGQFTHLTSYVSKAEQKPEALEPVTVAKLRCAAGLAHLEAKKYDLAARKFLEVGPDLGSSYNEVIASQDVATYEGLFALESFDRAELKACSKVIDNVSFQNFPELVPEVRELINGMSQLEMGNLSVVSFGKKGNIRSLHDFDQPFTGVAGIKMISGLTFKQENTIADEPVVDLLMYLNNMLDTAAAKARLPSGQNPLHQLVLIIGDGRFHEKVRLFS
ncbi:hypothetical protein Patl1_33607 [Pistacia atlantica]|uniref:Uncharacterized protein n=1 Tax=Pistacia atlantica TaxID=434234 RepID=A0ACC0ZWN0_9ROSI|nr:hypothetical protein Patl1_33607 [Pistacia atlantica]